MLSENTMNTILFSDDVNGMRLLVNSELIDITIERLFNNELIFIQDKDGVPFLVIDIEEKSIKIESLYLYGLRQHTVIINAILSTLLPKEYFLRIVSFEEQLSSYCGMYGKEVVDIRRKHGITEDFTEDELKTDDLDQWLDETKQNNDLDLEVEDMKKHSL